MSDIIVQTLVNPANYWLRLVSKIVDFSFYLLINVLVLSATSTILISGLGLSIDQSQEYFQACVSDISSPQCLNLGQDYQILMWSLPVFSTIIYILYFVIIPALVLPSTPAKILFQLHIISQDQEKPTILQLFVREIFFVMFIFFSFAPFLLAFSVAAGILQIFILLETSKALFSPFKTTWHDDLSATRVIEKQKLDKNENFI